MTNKSTSEHSLYFVFWLLIYIYMHVCTCILYVLIYSLWMLVVVSQVDLGTDAKHCFCKGGDLLAVVE